MYSHLPSVNILTSLLLAHGVKHAVVCPGSRNAPIVHNLNECAAIRCYPVTDERSAAFFALGIAQATDEPVVVCVTSGTALLNTAPALAEACYQHQSLIIISADRPAAWIGQLDGQTLQQPGALSPWVTKTVNLPDMPGDEAVSPSQHWHCNRLVNEALIEAFSDRHPCVHINVPLAEPLFRFTVSDLPEERVIRRFTPPVDYGCLPQALVDDLERACRPLIVFGQLSPRRFHYEGLDFLFSHVIVLHEALAPFTSVSPIEQALTILDNSHSAPNTQPSTLINSHSTINTQHSPLINSHSTINTQHSTLTNSHSTLNIQHSTLINSHSTINTQHSTLTPDFILYVGDAIVSKRLKAFLRQAHEARCWRVSLTGDVEDTFQNLCGVVVGDAEAILQSLNNKMSQLKWTSDNRIADYRRQWLQVLREARQRRQSTEPSLSSAAAVEALEKRLQDINADYEVHYANSTPVRLANTYVQGHPVWCNRGVNGIEGSLSTAAGFAAALSSLTSHLSPQKKSLSPLVFCVLGDLSFFYDQNALWNQNLSGNLRILLLNNGRGAIFDQLPGLADSPAARSYVAGAHATSAEGICRQHDVCYRQVTTLQQLHEGVDWLVDTASARPLLLEVLLDRYHHFTTSASPKAS